MQAATLRLPLDTRTRLLIALLAGLGCWLAISRVHPAGAFAEWCWDDPMVSINGVQVHTSVGAQAHPSELRRAVSRTTITFYLPQGADGRLVTPNTTYLHEQVRFQHSSQQWTPGTPMTVTVVVQFKASHNFAAGVRSREHDTVLGESQGDMSSGLVDSFTLSQ